MGRWGESLFLKIKTLINSIEISIWNKKSKYQQQVNNIIEKGVNIKTLEMIINLKKKE
jgi:hypothetical protein